MKNTRSVFNRAGIKEGDSMKAAAYDRYSTDRQCSIEVQFDAIAKYGKSNNLVLSSERMYADEALTGTNIRGRKGFQDLIRAATDHEFDWHCIIRPHAWKQRRG